MFFRFQMDLVIKIIDNKFCSQLFDKNGTWVILPNDACKITSKTFHSAFRAESRDLRGKTVTDHSTFFKEIFSFDQNTDKTK